ncbi:MAG: hypothetical protein JST12_20205 [Armatimonadetes bacterium]|nr:hypothetical protein [Armatimonadota bacterium]
MKRRGNWIFGGILAGLVLAAIALFFPSRRQIREDELRQEFSRMSTIEMATDQDFAQLQSAASFTIPASKDKRGDLYLFVPSLNTNISLLSHPASNPFVSHNFTHVDIHVIPVEMKESPVSNLAVKLALRHNGSGASMILDQAVSRQSAALPKLLDAWNALPPDEQASLTTAVKKNHELQAKIGATEAIVRYRNISLKSKMWSNLLNPFLTLDRFYN